MKIEISTSAKAIEVANMLLGHAIDALYENPGKRKDFGLTITDLKNAHAFRKSLLKSFTNGRVVLNELEHL